MKVSLIYTKNGFQLVDSRGRAYRDANAFLDVYRTRGLSKHTIDAYAYDLKVFLSWIRSTKELHSLGISHLNEFIEHQRKKQFAPRTINRRLSTIELFYRFVTGKRMSMSIPASNFRTRCRDRTLGIHRLAHKDVRHLRVKVPKKLIVPLSPTQVQLLLQRFSRYRDLMLVYLMLLCGLRSQEVLNIELGDVCPIEKTIRVHGKGNKERVLPIPDVILDVVQKYLSLERPSVCATNTLFVILQGAKRGSPMTRAGVRSLFRFRRHHPQLSSLHPHVLRHTFGASMASRGMSLPILQRMMGHAFPETTMQYINLSMTDLLEQFRLVSDKILGSLIDAS